MKTIKQKVIKDWDKENFVNGAIYEVVIITFLTLVLACLYWISIGLNFSFSLLALIALVQIMIANRLGKKVYKLAVNVFAKDNFTKEDLGALVVNSSAFAAALLWFSMACENLGMETIIVVIAMSSMFTSISFFSGPFSLNRVDTLEQKNSNPILRSDTVVMTKLQRAISLMLFFPLGVGIYYWYMNIYTVSLISN